jgi:hypothetical protein
MKPRTKHSAKKYEYHTSEAEILFKVVVNFKTPEGKIDWEKFQNWKDRMKENQNYCLCSIVKDDDHKCLCSKFRNSMKEGPCHCGTYTKVLRSDKEADAYRKKLDFDENSKLKKGKKKDLEETPEYSPEDFEVD